MNHTGVTRRCRSCHRPPMVIIDGAHLCSTHALDVTLGHPPAEETDPMVVDLRESDPVVGVEDVTELVRRLAS